MHDWQPHGGQKERYRFNSFLLAGSIGSGGQYALSLLCCGGASGGMPENPQFGVWNVSLFAS